MKIVFVINILSPIFQNMGKGSLWRVEQQYKQNLIQALTRSSYHPSTATTAATTLGEKGGTGGDDGGGGPDGLMSANYVASGKMSPRPADSPPFKVELVFHLHSDMGMFVFQKWDIKRIWTPGVFFRIQTTGRPLDAELFPRLSKYMAEIVSTPAATNAQQQTVAVATAASIYTSVNGSNNAHHPHTHSHHLQQQHHRHLLLADGSLCSNNDSTTPSPPGTPHRLIGTSTADAIIAAGAFEATAPTSTSFGNATTITNNHNNNTIVINNTASGTPAAGCFVNNGMAVFYNGSAERLVRDWGADSIDDVNAATAMLALKHGPKVFADGFHAAVAAVAAAASTSTTSSTTTTG